MGPAAASAFAFSSCSFCQVMMGLMLSLRLLAFCCSWLSLNGGEQVFLWQNTAGLMTCFIFLKWLVNCCVEIAIKTISSRRGWIKGENTYTHWLTRNCVVLVKWPFSAFPYKLVTSGSDKRYPKWQIQSSEMSSVQLFFKTNSCES